ncbi:hypothetical protein C1646_771589 [Rhizophagus diaphanus]|nr:hypothetical protein C1646_771589 [Rhizophagus diaphanus] [Rhizophagus sp. MUCL 43196]
MKTYENQIKYNDDDSVNVPFGYVAECFNQLERDLVSQIELKLAKNQQCWYWIMYCLGDKSNCQRLCNSIERCNENCENYNLQNNLKNETDTRTHCIFYNNNIPKILRINLIYSVRDLIALSRKVDHRTAKVIKAKLLTSLNGTLEKQIPAKFRYPIALIAFKIVDHNRTEETAIEIAKKYIKFINTFLLEKTKKDKLIDDLSKNWMCTEWQFEFGLVTLFNTQMIEQQTKNEYVMINFKD